MDEKTNEFYRFLSELSDKALREAEEKTEEYKALGSKYVTAMQEGINDKRDEAIAAAKKVVSDQLAAMTFANAAAKSSYSRSAKELLTAYTDGIKEGAEDARTVVSEAVSDLALSAQTAYDAVLKKQEGLQKKLGSYGDLYDLTDDGFTLTAVEMNLRTLDRYEEILTRLQEKGASADFMQMFSSLNIDKALEYGGGLVDTGFVRFEKYMTAWEEQQKKAKEIAEAFYGDELSQIEDSFASQLDTALSALPGQVEHIGAQVMQGLIDGILSKESDAAQAAQAIADSLKTTLTDAFEIHSPSRWMKAHIGKNLALGMTEGFAESLSPLTAELSRSALNAMDQTAYGAELLSPLSFSSGVQKESHRQTVIKEKVVGVEFSGTGAEVARLLQPRLKQESRRRGQSFTEVRT